MSRRFFVTRLLLWSCGLEGLARWSIAGSKQIKTQVRVGIEVVRIDTLVRVVGGVPNRYFRAASRGPIPQRRRRVEVPTREIRRRCPGTPLRTRRRPQRGLLNRRPPFGHIVETFAAATSSAFKARSAASSQTSGSSGASFRAASGAFRRRPRYRRWPSLGKLEARAQACLPGAFGIRSRQGRTFNCWSRSPLRYRVRAPDTQPLVGGVRQME